MDDKNIMISLGDERIKEISEVIGNKTCNKILDYLASTEGTVTDISEALKIPLNTADYNIKKLVKSGLIEKSSHWWSVKGKKMPVYKISNKKIIISPKKKITKNFLWALGLTGIAAFAVNAMTKTSKAVLDKGADLTFNAAPMATEALSRGTEEAVLYSPSGSAGCFLNVLGPTGWFLIGAGFAIALFIIMEIIKWRKRK